MLWHTWLLSDTVQNNPPLKILNSWEVSHLDSVPLKDEVTRCSQPACEILCDMHYLMVEYLERKAWEVSKWAMCVIQHQWKSLQYMSYPFEVGFSDQMADLGRIHSQTGTAAWHQKE